MFARAHNYQLIIDALDHNLPAAAVWCNREMQLTDQVQEMQEMQPFSSIGARGLSSVASSYQLDSYRLDLYFNEK